MRGRLTRHAMSLKTGKLRSLTDAEIVDMLSNKRQFAPFIKKYFAAPPSCLLTDLPENLEYFLRDFFERLDANFPHLIDLLKAHGGKIVAAGEAICKSMYLQDANEVELFFVGPEAGERDELLAEAIAFLSERWLSSGEETNDVYVLRSTTSVLVRLANDHIDIKYRFYLKVFPTPEIVMEEFDITPFMVVTDGHRVLVTELGAWTSFNQIIVVDTSRIKDGFEARLSKWSKCYRTIFPGLDPEMEQRKQAVRIPVALALNRLVALSEKSKFKVQCDDIPPGCSASDMASIIAYSSRFVPHSGGNLEEFQNLLQAKSSEFGYRLRLNGFAAIIRGTQVPSKFHGSCSDHLQRIMKPHDASPGGQVLTFRLFSLDLPTVSINLYNFSTDYNTRTGSENFPVSERHSCLRGSMLEGEDYASRLAKFNTKMMKYFNFGEVLSVLILRRPSSRRRYYFELDECSKIVEEDGECKEAILDSFAYPLFGDVMGVLRRKQTRDINHDYVVEGLARSKSLLAGVKWIEVPLISKNPPKYDPRSWYGEHYTSFRLGCQEVETCLRLMRLRNGPWKNLPRDIAEIIIRIVVWENSYLE
uniref:Uncharacterized protein n=1 Tax=viral metagenome TaxID=1070528 RepID=A0A6C0CHM2_9ZZZZ